MNYTVIREDELYHYGTLGMHWGVRRYQNADGSLTPAGKVHYQKGHGLIGRRMDAYKKARKEGEDGISAFLKMGHRGDREGRGSKYADKAQKKLAKIDARIKKEIRSSKDKDYQLSDRTKKKIVKAFTKLEKGHSFYKRASEYAEIAVPRSFMPGLLGWIATHGDMKALKTQIKSESRLAGEVSAKKYMDYLEKEKKK